MKPEFAAWVLLALAIFLLVIWVNERLDQREDQRLPQWDGSPQAYPATIEARIDLLIRNPHLAARLEEDYPS